MITVISKLMSYFENKTKKEIVKRDLVENLTSQEKVIVWGAREWLQHIRLARDPRDYLIKGFSPLLIQESVYHFDKFMRITAYSAIGSIDIRNHCCLKIGEGENNILACLTFSQNNFKNLNLNILSSILNNNSLNDGKRRIDEIAKSFTKAGLYFPIKKNYFLKAKVNPEDFNNVIFNQFNRNKLIKYY